jgi:hypothetical protein
VSSGTRLCGWLESQLTAAGEPDGLVADVDPAFGKQILDVAQRQRVSDMHHHDQTDDLQRTVEISERVAHGRNLPDLWTGRKLRLTLPTWCRNSRNGQNVFREYTLKYARKGLQMSAVLAASFLTFGEF